MRLGGAKKMTLENVVAKIEKVETFADQTFTTYEDGYVEVHKWSISFVLLGRQRRTEPCEKETCCNCTSATSRLVDSYFLSDIN